MAGPELAGRAVSAVTDEARAGGWLGNLSCWALLGGALFMLAAWWQGYYAVLINFGRFGPLAPGTALGLALLAGALLLPADRWRRIPALSSLVLGLLGLLQWWSGEPLDSLWRWLGGDTMLLPPDHTALLPALLLTGLGVLLSASGHRGWRLSGCLVAVVVLAQLPLYVLWWEGTPPPAQRSLMMAPEAAIGFAVVAAALLWGRGASTTASLTIILLGVLITCGGWFGLGAQQQGQLNNDTAAAATHLSARMAEAMTLRVEALERMAQRWSLWGGEPPAPVFQREAGSYLRDFNSLLAVAFLDEEGGVADFLARSEGSARAWSAVREASGLDQLADTWMWTLEGGRELVVVPVNEAGRRVGYVAAESTSRALMSQLMADVLFHAELRRDGAPVFRSADVLPGYRAPAQARERVTLYGADWELWVWPSRQLTQGVLTLAPQLFLISGLVLTGLMVWTHRFAISAREERRIAARAQAHLVANERRLALLMDGTSDAFIDIGDDWRLDFANPVASRERVAEGEDARESFPWLLEPAVVTLIERARGESRPQRGDVRHGQRWLALRAYPRPGSVLLQWHDCSLVKRREQWLAAELSLLHRVAGGEGHTILLPAVVATLEEALPRSRVSIMLCDRGGAHLHPGASSTGLSELCAALAGISVNERPAGFAPGTAVFSSDLQNDIAWRPCRELISRLQLHSCLAQPVMGGGSYWGTIAIYWREHWIPSDDELIWVERLAALCAIALAQGQGIGERECIAVGVRHHAARLHTLNEVAVGGYRLLEGGEAVFHYLVEQARDLLGCHECVLSLRYSDGRPGLSVSAFSDALGDVQGDMSPPEEGELCARVMAENTVVRLAREEHPDAPRGWLGVPLVKNAGGRSLGAGNGAVRSVGDVENADNCGLLQWADKQDGEFTEEDEVIARQFAHMAEIALEQLEQVEMRERSRRELEQRLQFLEAVSLSVGEGVVVTDEQARITYVNGEACRLLGYTREELLDRSVDTLFQGVEGGRAATVLERVVQLGRTESFADVWLDTVRDHSVNVALRVTPLRGGARERRGAVITFRDITLEQRALHALEEHERFFTLALELFATLTPSGHFVQVNPAFTRQLGWPADELMNHPFADFVHPEDRPALDPLLLRLREGERVEGFVQRFRTRSGEWRWLEWHGVMYGDVLIYAAARDITARRLAEQARDRALAELRAGNEELREFTAFASHDLQAPLRRIRAFAARLARVLPTDNDDATGDLQRLDRAAQRMQRLIDDLLRYAGLGRSEAQAGWVDLQALVNDVWAELEPQVLQTGAILECGGLDGSGLDDSGLDNGGLVNSAGLNSTDLPRLWGEGSQLRQLLLNLMHNALKFRDPERVPRISVTAVTRRSEGRDGWLLSVADNGVGFEAVEAERILQPFVRLPGGGPDGSGIGLAIVNKVVQRCGGWLQVESTPGQGSRFDVWLPREVPPMDAVRE